MKRDEAGLPVELPSWPECGIESCECHFEERLVLGEFDNYLEAAIEQKLAELDDLALQDGIVERERS